MKTWSRLLIVSFLLVTTGHGQSVIYRETVISEPDVPEVVLQVFKAAYPTSRARRYLKVETDGAQFYKIEVGDDSGERYFSYTPNGELRKIENVIAAVELPAIAQQSVQEKYPNAIIDWAEKIIQGERISYRANAKKEDKLFTLEFDAEGKVTSAHEVRVTNVFTRMPQ